MFRDIAEFRMGLFERYSSQNRKEYRQQNVGVASSGTKLVVHLKGIFVGVDGAALFE